jgi:hypothetical protein
MEIKPKSPYAAKSTEAGNSDEIAPPFSSTQLDDDSEEHKPKHGSLHGKLIGAIFFAAVQLGAPFAPVAHAAPAPISQVQTVQSGITPLDSSRSGPLTADPPAKSVFDKTPPTFATTHASTAAASAQNTTPTTITVAITFAAGHSDEAAEIVKQLSNIHPEHHSIWDSLGSTLKADVLPSVFSSLIGPAILEYLKKRKDLKEKKTAQITIEINQNVIVAEKPEDLEKTLNVIEAMKIGNAASA